MNSKGELIPHERAMGGVHWDSWPDNIWYYGSEGGRRFLGPKKIRGYDYPFGWTIGVSWNGDMHHIFASGRTREEEQERHKKQALKAVAKKVVAFVAKNPDCTGNAIEESVDSNSNMIRQARAWAAERKYLVFRDGPNRSNLHQVTKRGKEWLNE
jgi:hypothetical protein